MVATNQEALANPVYNPPLDPTAVELYKLMPEPSPKLMAEYKLIIDNLPTESPFQGVLTNPRTCEVEEASNLVTQIETALKTRYEQIVEAGTPVVNENGVPTYTPSPADVATLQEWQQSYPQAISSLGQASDGTNSFQNHTNKWIANLPMILGAAQSAMGIATAAFNLLNPCLGTGDFIGSLMAKGAELMRKVIAALQAVMALINGVISAIMAAIAAVMGIITAIINLIQQEIMKLIRALIDMARMGLGALLSLLPDDPCFRALVSGVATGAAVAILNKKK